MKYVLDTGPLVAFLDANETPALRRWAAETLSVLPWPLYTCEAVLTEAAHFLRTPLPLVEMVAAGELLLPFTLADQAPDLARTPASYGWPSCGVIPPSSRLTRKTSLSIGGLGARPSRSSARREFDLRLTIGYRNEPPSYALFCLQ